MARYSNLMYVENGRARIVVVCEGQRLNQIETCTLQVGRYVRIDDGRHYPQLCEDGGQRGATLEYQSDASLARDCRARLFKTERGFEAAKARIPAAY